MTTKNNSSKLEIIGLSGKASSGKDFIYNNFFKPLGFCRFALADHFKVWIVGKGDATHDEVFNTKPPHVRKLLQQEGTERGRNVYGENIWVNTAFEWMNILHEFSGINSFVIPDVRFPNELKAIQSWGGKVFRIESPTRAKNSNLSLEARQHISETALDGCDEFDGFIYNDPHLSETVGMQVRKLLGQAEAVDDPEDLVSIFGPLRLLQNDMFFHLFK